MGGEGEGVLVCLFCLFLCLFEFVLCMSSQEPKAL